MVSHESAFLSSFWCAAGLLQTWTQLDLSCANESSAQREIASLGSEIVKPLRCHLIADLRDGKLSSFSCTIALSSLVASICKLNEEKRTLDERLAELPLPQSAQVSKLFLEQERWAGGNCIAIVNEYGVDINTELERQDELRIEAR